MSIQIILCQALTNRPEHRTIAYKTSFYCFINGKIKKESVKKELDINVAKHWQFRVFPQQAANSAANGVFRGVV